MAPLSFASLRNAFQQVRGFVVASAGQSAVQIVDGFRIVKTCLQDRRSASGAVFAINFALFEIALRISKVAELILPNATKSQENIQFAARIILGSGLMIAGNMAFAMAFEITLHPLVITAIAIASLIVRSELERYAAKK